MSGLDTDVSNLWNSVTRGILKDEMSRCGVSKEDLVASLGDIGVHETIASVGNKISRGTFGARFMVQSLLAIDSPLLGRYRESVLDRVGSAGEVEETSGTYGSGLRGWEIREGFLEDRFSSDWYVDTSAIPKKSVGKVVSLFTGAGGMDLGLEQAGFETSVCVEIDEDCKATLRKNRPSWNILDGENGGDVRSVEVSDILKIGNLERGEASLVVGGAPCQPFSNIGKREGAKDRKNGGDLFQEFVRVVDGVLPQGFIFENVVGITQQKHNEVLDYMKSCLSGLGYSLSYKILNAADYGVPQKRARFFLLGLRGDRAPAFPMQTHFKDTQTFSEVCFNLGITKRKKMKRWVSIKDIFKKITERDLKRSDNVVMNVSELVKNRMALIGPGENFHVLPMEMRPDCWKSGKHQGQDTFGRLKLEEPSATIRTAAYNPSKGRYIHPVENRGLNSIELAALQGFPKQWVFESSKYDRVTLTSAGRQIGNAVPPPLARAIGMALSAQLGVGERRLAKAS